MPRGTPTSGSAQRQQPDSHSSNNDNGPTTQLWSTNDQHFPEWYPTLIRALKAGPVEYQSYVEKLTTTHKHYVCCISANHVTIMERNALPHTGTFEKPLLASDIPTATVPVPLALVTAPISSR